jgi:hypothetical protein
MQVNMLQQPGHSQASGSLVECMHYFKPRSGPPSMPPPVEKQDSFHRQQYLEEGDVGVKITLLLLQQSSSNQSNSSLWRASKSTVCPSQFNDHHLRPCLVLLTLVEWYSILQITVCCRIQLPFTFLLAYTLTPQWPFNCSLTTWGDKTLVVQMTSATGLIRHGVKLVKKTSH